MVVLSLLVLSFPLAAFADTEESVPVESTVFSQEQTIESIPVPSEATTESQEPDLNDPASPDNKAVEEPEKANEEATVSESDTQKVPAETATKDSGTEEEVTKASEATVTPKASAELETSKVATAQKPASAYQTASTVKQSQAELEKELNQEWTAEKIRENLNGTDYGINQKELQGYTDQELTNAFKLFIRYNFDIIGMDLGSYVRVLRMVYQEKVMSWADVEQALTFNPHNYQTTAEYAQNVDQLQNYLRVLYPEIRHFSNEEMLHVLDHLSGAEGELSRANGLFLGFINWLYNSQEGNGPIDNGPKPAAPLQNLVTTNPIITNLATIPVPTTTPATVKNDGEQVQATTNQKEYPKTGEKSNVSLIISGIVLLLITGFVILKRRIRS